MGEPKAHEHEVVALLRRPLEQIGLDVIDVVASHASAIAGDHFGRCVNRGDMRDMRRQMAREQTGAARELENAPRSHGVKEREQRAFDNGDIGEEGRVELGAAVETPLAKPPLIVFAPKLLNA